MALFRRKSHYCRIHTDTRAYRNGLCQYCLECAPALALKLMDLSPSAQMMIVTANDIAALRLMIAKGVRRERV